MMEAVYLWADAFLIWFFRLSSTPIIGYYLGCFALAGICVLIGQFSIAIVFLWNRDYIEADSQSMVSLHNSSMKALASKNKQAYKQCNKAANEAFGKVFFSQIAMAASSLWPIPIAAGWMQTRFLDVSFPLPVTLPVLGDSVGFLFTFLPIYVLVFLLFGKIKPKLPFFRRISAYLKTLGEKEGEKMIHIKDLATAAGTAKKEPVL